MNGCLGLHECPEVGAVCACCFGGECRCLCGYSNCFRPMVARRGFMKVCAVHKADPRKWPDGRFTGSTFVKVRGIKERGD